MKKFLSVLVLLCTMFTTVIFSACTMKEDNNVPVDGEPNEAEVYETSFERLAEYIQENADIDQILSNSHGYSAVDIYTADISYCTYTLSFIYMDMYETDDIIAIDWTIDKVFEKDTITIMIPQKVSRSVKVLWEDGFAGDEGEFYIEPRNTYKNTNITFSMFDFNDEHYGGIVDPTLEAAENVKLMNEMNASEGLSECLGETETYLHKVEGVRLSDFGFDKINQKKADSQATKLLIAQDDEMTMKVGETHQLSYAVYPFFTSDKEKFVSSNSAVVQVDDEGYIKCVGAGSATVTLTAGAQKHTFRITVKAKTNVDLAREFLEKNLGKKFNLEGNPISSASVGNAYIGIEHLDLDSGERVYLFNYFPNSASNNRLDVAMFCISITLGNDITNIVDIISTANGTYTVYTQAGGSNYDMTYVSNFRLSSSGEIYNLSYKQTNFNQSLNSYDSLTYLTNMRSAANVCLTAIKNILAKNAKAYFDTTKTPTFTLQCDRTSQNTAVFSYNKSNYYDEHISSVNLYKDGEFVKDCTAEFLNGEMLSGLYSNTSYSIKVRCSYNKNDGKGEQYIERTVSFRTQAVVLPELDANVSTTTDSVQITVSSLNSTPFTVEYIALYKSGVFVEQLEMFNRVWQIDGLLSNTQYSAKITYSYDLNDGHGERQNTKTISVSTRAYEDPSVNLNADSNYTQVQYTLQVSSAPALNFNIEKVELWKGEALLNVLETEKTGSLSDLLAGNEYILKVSCSFDKNDGNGVQSCTYSLPFRTRAYNAPTFSHTATVSYDSIEYAISPSAVDEVNYSLQKIELVSGDEVISSTQELSGVLSSLLTDTDYNLQVTYTYNLQDGNGVRTGLYTIPIHTQAYATPTVEIIDVAVDQNTFTFDTLLTDANTLAQFESLSLYLGDSLVATLQEGDIKTFGGLLFGNTYTLVVKYRYDKNDGKGEQFATHSVDVSTYTKITPEVDIDIATFTDEAVSFAITLTDPDATAKITKAELVVDGAVVSSLSEFLDISNLTLNGLTADARYDVVVTYSYDLADDAGVHTSTQSISANNTKFTYEKTEDRVTITGINDQYVDDLTTLTVPQSIDGISNIVIQSLQFGGQDTVTSLIISDSVASISFAALQGYTALENLTIPFVGNQRGGSSNTHFGYVFGGNYYSDNATVVPTTLQSLTITDETEIASYAFYGCINITKVVVPDSVTSIGLGAFKGCNAIEDVTLPFVGQSLSATYEDTVFGHIFGNELYSCYNYKSEYDGADKTKIGSYNIRSSASYNFENRVVGTSSQIHAPKDLIWQYSNYSRSHGYYYNYYLTSYYYYIPTTIKNVTITVQTEIPVAAFNGCGFIETIILPTETTSIGEYAFQNCSAEVKQEHVASIAAPWNGTSVATGYRSGSGTAEDPYIIFSGAHLAYFAEQINGGNNYRDTYFKLVADIDLGGKPFPVIGTDADHAFAGGLDGCGYKIKSFSVQGAGEYVGLFGYCSGTIRNLTLQNGSVTSTSSAQTVYIGGMVGYLTGVIEKCVSECSVSASGATNSYIGGMTGHNAGSILYSYATGTVNGTANTYAYAGGFVGNNAGSITDCYASGKVFGYSTNLIAYAGGFVGTMTSEIEGCFASGNVLAKGATEAYSRNGGFVGLISDESLLVQCYRASEQILTKYTSIGSAYSNEGIVVSKADILAFCKTSWDDAVWDFGSELPKLK